MGCQSPGHPSGHSHARLPRDGNWVQKMSGRKMRQGVYVGLSVCICVYLCVPYVSVCQGANMGLYVSMSVCMCLCFYMCLTVFVCAICVYVGLLVCICVSKYVCVSNVCLYVRVPVYLCISICVYMYLSVYMCLYVSV